MQFDLRDLKFFAAIAEENSFSKAAQKVHRTQPALTKCIQRLEEVVGADLFERSGRGVRLTAVGEALKERVTYLTNTVEETVRDISSLARGVSGHVRIGSIPVVVEYLLPGVCRHFFQSPQDVSMRIVPETTGKLLELLRANKLDCIIIPMSEQEEDFATSPIMTDEVVVVASPSHPVFAIPSPTLRDLSTFGWLLPSTVVGIRPWLDRLFSDHGLPRPSVRIEVPCVRLMPKIIAEANLLSFVSSRRLHPGSYEHSLLRTVPVKEAVMHRTFSVAWVKNRPLAPVAQKVIRLLEEKGTKLYGEE